jgi:hypothetical protein
MNGLDGRGWVARLRRAVVLIACISLVGCTSMHRVEAEPVQIRQLLRDGQLVKPGDHVRVRAADGTRHRLHVASIDQEALHSKTRNIAIEQVTELEIERFSIAKTVLLAAGLVVVAVTMAAYSADWDDIQLFEDNSSPQGAGP